MKGDHIRKRSGKFSPVTESADEAMYQALDALDAAMEQIVRIECAEERARTRLRTLEATILAFLADTDREGTEQAPMSEALQALMADLALMEETLPLEQAFREDERDRAMATIADAQRVLNAGRAGVSHRIGMALALGPDQIGQSARIFARISSGQSGHTGPI